MRYRIPFIIEIVWDAGINSRDLRGGVNDSGSQHGCGYSSNTRALRRVLRATKSHWRASSTCEIKSRPTLINFEYIASGETGALESLDFDLRHAKCDARPCESSSSSDPRSFSLQHPLQSMLAGTGLVIVAGNASIWHNQLFPFHFLIQLIAFGLIRL